MATAVMTMSSLQPSGCEPITVWAAMWPATPDDRPLRLAQAMAKKYVPARVA